MITITIPAKPKTEMWDPVKEEFQYTDAIKETTITLEHSLISISKWESKWKKAFLKKEEKTIEEVIDYIKCMTIEKNVPDAVYNNIPDSEMKRITEYIEDRMSATYVKQKPVDNKGDSNRKEEVVTSELIYYWMIANQIPFECERWHINRLMALIQVCSVKNAAMYGGKKKSRSNQNALLRHNTALNASRRAKLGSTG
jgi:hypothetical protein